jgi:hypothetical protein
MIDFEKDQESVIQKTENIHSLADQVERLQQIQEDISKNEEYLKQKKKELDHISGEVIPTMLSEMGLSYLKLTDGLGQLSPEVNKRDGKYVEGASPGMILNTVTNEVFDGEKGIDVLPVFYKRQLVEWQDRGESKGAPVAIHDASSDIMSKTTRDKSYKDRLPNGNYIENTANHFVVLLSKSPTTALISMRATQLKVSRKWNSMMMGIKMQGKNGLFTPPTYSHIYKLKTVQMSNDKGTWFGWDVSMVGSIQDKAVYDIAKNFAESVSKGEVQAKHETDEAPKARKIDL